MTTCVNRGRYAPPSCFRKFSPPLGYFPPSFFPPAYNRHLDFHSSPSGRSRARKKFIAGVNPRRRLSEQEGAQKVTLSRAHYSIGREQKREEEARERALRDDRSEAARRSPFFQDQFVWIGEVIGGRRRSRTNERTNEQSFVLWMEAGSDFFLVALRGSGAGGDRVDRSERRHNGESNVSLPNLKKKKSRSPIEFV